MLGLERTDALFQNHPIDHPFTVFRPIRYYKLVKIEENRTEMLFIFSYVVSI